MATITYDASGRKEAMAEWAPVAAGLLALYLPTFYDLANGLWRTSEQAHGPLILIAVVYLIWIKREVINRTASGGRPAEGAIALAAGLTLYITGRSQDILIFEIASLSFVLTAILLMMRGCPAFRAAWFPIFFSLFLIPLPGPLVDAVTLPMKLGISYSAEHLLYWFGYPVGRAGVELQIGQYKLLVADACAGIQTLFTLEAMGLLYLNMFQHSSLVRNFALASFIIPISFLANLIRVATLTLITYHFGDETGQGFLHDFAGIVLFLTALILIVMTDTALRYGLQRSKSRPAATLGNGHDSFG